MGHEEDIVSAGITCIIGIGLDCRKELLVFASALETVNGLIVEILEKSL